MIMNKSAIFQVMFQDVLGLALQQWKMMFIEISATFAYAMAMKLKIIIKVTVHTELEFRLHDDWCQV